ncbi:acyltransferase [Mannheimia haemolytica]|uniref:acyltransferase n=1 Tax=Mannheimia haemolytica TaxID=75985 RepID=UPI001CF5D411|nr:acyltransferase [Mannheimia haemolytica]MCB4226943.1 acyltransferase [Mannheimia haemolytica]
MDTLRIELIKKDGTVEVVDNIPGVRFNCSGQNNLVRVHENTTFNNCLFSLSGGMVVSIAQSKFNLVGLSIFGKESNVKIGSNFSCWGVEIRCHEQQTSVFIGDNCMFAQDILIYPTDVHTIFDQFTGEVLNLGEPITIGNNVWCARGVTLLKGTTIRNNVVIGAGSIVSRKFNENNIIIAGNPANVIRRGIDWVRDTPFEYQQKLLK